MSSKFGSHTSVQKTPRVCHAPPTQPTPWPPLTKQRLFAEVWIWHESMSEMDFIMRRFTLTSGGGYPIEWFGEIRENYPNINLEVEYDFKTGKCNMKCNWQIAGFPQHYWPWTNFKPRSVRPFNTGRKGVEGWDYELSCLAVT